LDRFQTDSVGGVDKHVGSEVLRSRGLRVTATRLAVLETLAELPAHVTVEQVEQGARKRLGAISTQAVYDIMRALHEARLVRRIEPAGSAALFETRVDDNHHHFICRNCGTTVDVDCILGAAPCLTAGFAAGFEVDEAEVIFWGRCPECIRREGPAHRKARRDSHV
jgi:Fur family ferric uptake transcriptional regulator